MPLGDGAFDRDYFDSNYFDTGITLGTEGTSSFILKIPYRKKKTYIPFSIELSLKGILLIPIVLNKIIRLSIKREISKVVSLSGSLLNEISKQSSFVAKNLFEIFLIIEINNRIIIKDAKLKEILDIRNALLLLEDLEGIG